MRYPEEMKQRAREMRLEGWGRKQIAEHFGINKSTLQPWLRHINADRCECCGRKLPARGDCQNPPAVLPDGTPWEGTFGD